MSKIKKIQHQYPYEILQARIDESIVTGQPLVENPHWFENTETGQMYFDLFGAIAWPSEVSDKDEGMPGYCAVVGVVKPKAEGKAVQDAVFQLLAEAESPDVPTLLEHVLRLRDEYGFGLHPELLHAWFGDPDRFITTLALLNEKLMVQGDKYAILVTPPADYYVPNQFDHYVRSLRSTLMPGKVRFYFGGCDILRNHLREFKKDCPAVVAVGGLIHSLLGQVMWMSQRQNNMFTIEEGDYGEAVND